MPCPTSEALHEGWRPVPQDPLYEVAWDGRIRRLGGQPLKPQQAKGGRYQKVTLSRGKQVQVHQIVCEAWHGPKPPGMPRVVDHRDNDGHRNCATNLRWLTYQMNTRNWYAMQARLEAAGIAAGHDQHGALSDEEWERIYEKIGDL